jgi:hypothetical protein
MLRAGREKINPTKNQASLNAPLTAIKPLIRENRIGKLLKC